MPGGGFKIGVRHGIDAFIADIGERQKDHLFWTAGALTLTAKDVEAAEVEKIAAVFDRPTRFALNALYVKPATKHELVAEVRFKEGFGSIPAWRFLGPQVEGGRRHKKSHERALERAGILRPDEYAVPGKGVTLDANGNMKGGEITRILSDLGANPDPLSNSTARSRRTKKGRARGRYFVLRPDASDIRYQRRGVQPGIYWRKQLQEIVPVIVFVKAPHYRKLLPFYETAQDVVQRRFAPNYRAMKAKYPPRRSVPSAA